jgi:hypothetical protein
MEAMRQSWTDERLDDLNRRVDGGFRRVDERFGQIESRMLQGFIALVGIQVTSLVTIIGFIAVHG